MRHVFVLSTTLLLCLSSCRKDLADNIATAVNSSDAATAYTLTLQPGPADGDDLWTKNWINHPYYADTCDTKVALIKGLAASLDGTTVYTRSVIKFDALSQLPAGAKIISATLYLYGPSPTSAGVKTHLPSGNSSYPGSDKGDNTCLLQRITSSWNANTISWNNPPVSTTTDQVVLKASDKQWQYDITADVTQLVRMMIVDSQANNGFLLKLQTEERPRFMGFISSNSREIAKRPKLVVTYSPI